MPSSEKIVSPGIFTNEIDQSFLPAAVGDIGAALIGPTMKGPALVPTVVSSYSEYRQIFGDTFKSGSQNYTYLTSTTAKEYLKSGNKLTVVRILDGDFTPASATIGTTNTTAATSTFSVTDGDLTTENQFTEGEFVKIVATDGTVGIYILSDGSETDAVATGTVLSSVSDLGTGTPDAALLAQGTCIAVQNNLNTHAQHAILTEIAVAVASANSPLKDLVTTGSISGTGDGTQTLVFTQVGLGADGNTKAFTNISQLATPHFSGGGESFKLHALADGAIMNNTGSHTGTTLFENSASNSVLQSGSKHNIRYEVTQRNNKKGTISFVIRAGNDTIKRKQVLETWNNVSLDPNSKNYIASIVGDSQKVFSGTESEPYIAYSGSYPNKSKYVRVEVTNPLVDYLDENGNVRVPADSASLPATGSGSFGGGFHGGDDGFTGFDALGNGLGNAATVTTNFYENISTQTQGYNPETDSEGKTAYTKAINLLKNQDEYDVNLVLLPGITNDKHSTIVQRAIDMAEERGDTFVVVDPVVYKSAVSTAVTQGDTLDSSYAATYWPWVQVPESELGRNVWVPPSVVISGVYAFNDKIAHPWFAPAGLNRGGIDTAIMAERKLTQANRDDLYDANVNPIATFPGQGVCVWGQKTLQKKASALDRVNVRRLLIKLKKFIASTSRFLVFEQNNTKTRNRFLNIVNPYMESVQSNSGLTAFKIVMDESNNTPDIVDRNILYGQIFVQPTRTAEFIVLDFTVQPTGATFPE